MLFDLDKARRHFDEDVRFAEAGGIDKRALEEAVVASFLLANDIRLSPTPKTVRELTDRYIKYVYGELKKYVDKFNTLLFADTTYKKMFAKPASEIYKGSIVAQYRRLTGQEISENDALQAKINLMKPFLQAGMKASDKIAQESKGWVKGEWVHRP